MVHFEVAKSSSGLERACLPHNKNSGNPHPRDVHAIQWCICCSLWGDKRVSVSLAGLILRARVWMNSFLLLAEVSVGQQRVRVPLGR